MDPTYREAQQAPSQTARVLLALMLVLAILFTCQKFRGEPKSLIPRRFGLLLSHLWPSKDILLQLWMVAAITTIILERFSLALGNQRLGILVDRILTHDGRDSMFRELALWTSLNVLGSFRYVKYTGKIRLTHFWETRVRSGIFAHLMDLSADYHNSNDAAQKQKLIAGAGKVASLHQTIVFELLPAAVDLLVSCFYLRRAVGVLPTTALMLAGVTHLVFCNITETWVRGSADLSSERRLSEHRFVHNRISNWYTISLFDASEQEKRAYRQRRTEYCDADRKYSDRCFAYFEIQRLILTLSKVGTILIIINRVSTKAASVGEVVSLVSHWEFILDPIEDLVSCITRMERSRPVIERIIGFLRVSPTVANPGREHLTGAPYRIEIEGVTFAYDSRQPLLDNISITLDAGKTTALVGATGSGKSTIFNLLLRHYEVTKGSITIDGVKINELDVNNLRKNIGAIPQDPQLLQGTLYENLRYGRPSATEEEVVEVCKAVSIHDKITRLPESYHTEVGDGGQRLSGGEAQRVAIARAILKRADIFLIDEATSSVDSNTECQIKETLSKACAGKTTLIIAHRLSTIMNVDQIVVIGNRTVLETGTHSELLDLQGEYYKLWQKQTGGVD